MITVLVVEDDHNLRLTLVDNLEMEGYRVLACDSLRSANQCLDEEDIDVIVLDIMLPDGSGYDFCQRVREQAPQIMILMLTARTLDADLLQGFAAGTDDYLTKPYKLEELLARIKALVARSNRNIVIPGNTVLNGFKIDWDTRQVNDREIAVHLTKKEFDLLRLLYDNLSVPLSRTEILDEIWGDKVCVEERTVDNFVSNIRRSLQLLPPNRFQIRTVRGVGYCLVEVDSTA